MREHGNPRTFILSAHRSGNTAAQNRAAHCDLSCDLALIGVPFKECEGSYKGVREDGYIIVGAEHQLAVWNLAVLFGQETYLAVAEHDRTAYLVNAATGHHTHVGPFRCLGSSEPDAEAWTLFDGVYFGTTPTDGVDLPEGF